MCFPAAALQTIRTVFPCTAPLLLFEDGPSLSDSMLQLVMGLLPGVGTLYFSGVTPEGNRCVCVSRGGLFHTSGCAVRVRVRVSVCLQGSSDA